MNINKVLTPRMSNKTILLMMFAYLAMVTVLLVMAAKPFESASALDLGVNTNTVSTAEVLPTIDFQTPAIHVPAAPYIIVEPAN